MTTRLFVLTFLIFTNFGSYAQMVFIPAKGNTWNTSGTSDQINHKGLVSWKSTETIFVTYFKVNRTGKVNLALVARTNSGKSSIEISFNNKAHSISIANTKIDTIPLGTFTIDEIGYQELSIQGLYKSGDSFGHFEGVVLSGEIVEEEITCVRDDFYWGRRGPSVHLRYRVPENTGNVTWFYNEITVPKGDDVIGSYFMANGFTEGYFGIQVNSENERRILFSVWSPYKTDDPNSIPEEYKIRLLGKGPGVYTGEFGNEGSGGQSYLRYMWKAGNTYRFLLKGEPSENESTDFTAYFFAPELNEWQLIASFSRPKTKTYLKDLHSFLENFITETGNIKRRLYYSNQWVYNTNNKWVELKSAIFTADATALKGSRLDYYGGKDGARFFLQNCGFTNDNLPINTRLDRLPTNREPKINFSKLPTAVKNK